VDSSDSESLVTLIDDALNARDPDELEIALRRVVRHPLPSEDERRDFHALLEELSDTLLERWHDLNAWRDCVAWSALHHQGGDEKDPRRSPENDRRGRRLP
jgi:hypothetical protein